MMGRTRREKQRDKEEKHRAAVKKSRENAARRRLK